MDAYEILTKAVMSASQVQDPKRHDFEALARLLKSRILEFERADNTKAIVIDLQKARAELGKLDRLSCLSYLVKLVSAATLDPLQAEVLLESAIQTQIAVPRLLAINQESYSAVSKEDDSLFGCRDHLRLHADAIRGTLFLQAHSTGSCFPPESPGHQRISVLAAKFHNPQIQMKCEQSGDDVLCRPVSPLTDYDTMDCGLGRAGSSKALDEPWARISPSGRVQVHYLWCSRFDSKEEKMQLDRTYDARSEVAADGPEEEDARALLEIERNVEAARQILIRVFSDPKTEQPELGVSVMRFIDEKRQSLLEESLHSSIVFDRESMRPFVHEGQATWIETTLRRHGEIRIRPRPFLHRLRGAGPRVFVHWLAHEIAHHLGESEAGADQAARMIEGFVSVRVPVMSLLDLSLGTYFAPKQGCRDQMEIVSVDAFTGRVKIRASSSQGHCRILGRYMDRVSPMNRYAFDATEMEMQCEASAKGLICRDLAPENQFALCPVSVRSMKQVITEELRSALELKEPSGVKLSFNWCVEEVKHVTRVAQAEVPYSKRDQRIGLTQTEIANARRLENALGGGLYHLCRSSDFQACLRGEP
jgi:hypothetical protein